MSVQLSDDEVFSVAIIGCGVGAICLGAQLGKVGIPYVVFEKLAELGGTWRENIYPGAASDNPSHQYSYSFELNPDWSRVFAEQPELLAYFQRTAEKYGVSANVRLNTEVLSAVYDDDLGLWHIETSAGSAVARCLVSAVGQLNRPSIPGIKGMDRFQGKMFHSAQWEVGHDLTNKSVAVIGTGASAVQLIPPVAAQAARLTIFQRSPNWIQPRGDRFYTPREQWLFRHLPLAGRLYRYLIYWTLEREWGSFVKDTRAAKLKERQLTGDIHTQANTAMAKDLTPRYAVGCKRVLVADDYYDTLNRSNVDVITSPIDCFEPHAIVTVDGQRYPIDTCVLATGFHATEFLMPMQIQGRDGLQLHERWKDGAEAYLGMSVSGFPNFFMLYGPNTNLGHNSIIFMLECQTRYIIQCLKLIFERDLIALEVKNEAMRRYDQATQSLLSKMAWTGHCDSWYKKTAKSRIINNWPGTTPAYFWRTLRPDVSDYDMRPRSALTKSCQKKAVEYAWNTCL